MLRIKGLLAVIVVDCISVFICGCFDFIVPSHFIVRAKNLSPLHHHDAQHYPHHLRPAQSPCDGMCGKSHCANAEPGRARPSRNPISQCVLSLSPLRAFAVGLHVRAVPQRCGRL